MGRPRPARLQLPAHRRAGGDRRRPARAARRAARGPGGGRGRSTPSASRPRRRRPRRRGRPRRARPAAAPTAAPSGAAGSSTSSGCPAGADRDAVIAELVAARHRGEGLPALHPPDRLLPRALRLSRGEFPVAEDASGALAGAAVLPGARRGPGRARLRGARRGAPGALDLASLTTTGSTLASPPMSRVGEPRSSFGGSTPRSASTGGSGPYDVDRLARPRAGSASAPACSTRPSSAALDAASTQVGARARARRVRVRSPTTRTSTWRSSGG